MLQAADPAAQSFRKSQKIRAKGDPIEAYRKAVAAVALDPQNPKYWAWLKAIQRPALEKARMEIAGLGAAEETVEEADTPTRRELMPPPVLDPKPGAQDLNLTGDPRLLFQRLTKAYGLDCVFDGDYPEGGRPQRFVLSEADAVTALRALQAQTGSFVVVLGPKLLLVSKDNDQKRRDLEPAEAVTIPLPDTISPQDVTEAMNAVRMAFDLTKVGLDTARRQIVIRDRISRTEPARMLMEQLVAPRGEVYVELEFLTTSRSRTRDLGATVNSSYSFFGLGDYSPSYTTIPSTITQLFTFGGGASLIGVTLTDAELVAAASRSAGRTLYKAGIRASDSQAASIHIGDRYPILTGGYYGLAGDTGGGTVYRPPPQVQFEDLGLVFKATPRLHNAEEVSLEIEAEFKALSGKAQNDIPILENRKLKTTVRLRYDQAAVVAGLVNEQLVQSWSFPLFKTSKQPVNQDVLVVIRPYLLRPPSAESAPAKAIWAGTESRLLLPLGQ